MFQKWHIQSSRPGYYARIMRSSKHNPRSFGIFCLKQSGVLFLYESIEMLRQSFISALSNCSFSVFLSLPSAPSLSIAPSLPFYYLLQLHISTHPPIINQMLQTSNFHQYFSDNNNNPYAIFIDTKPLPLRTSFTWS